LQSDVGDDRQTGSLLSKGLIRENHWHLNQLLTTKRGSEVANQVMLERIEKTGKGLQNMEETVPPRALAFFVNRHISMGRAFSTERPLWSESWENCLLNQGRLWAVWIEFLASLEALGLAVRTHNYVSTGGGMARDICYVIPREVQDSLSKRYSSSDFDPNQIATLRLFNVLSEASSVFDSEDTGYLRRRCYELLQKHSVTEEELAGIVNEMSMKRITSPYRGLLSDEKPFDIIDRDRLRIYLDENIIEPAADVLTGRKERIREYASRAQFPDLAALKTEMGVLDLEERGGFYVIVCDFERQLRDFIKETLGKGWAKRLRNDIPRIVEEWEEKKQREEKYGISPEPDLIDYADPVDYIEIVRKYDRAFCDGPEDLERVVTHLADWYVFGRNPLMHARTIDRQKYYTTKSTIEFLHAWMRRKKQKT